MAASKFLARTLHAQDHRAGVSLTPLQPGRAFHVGSIGPWEPAGRVLRARPAPQRPKR